MGIEEATPRIVTDGGLDLVFWPVGLGHLSFSDHLEIAQAGGFTSLAVTPTRAKRLMRQGQPAQDILEQAQARGLRLNPIDGIATWVTDWRGTKGDPNLLQMMTDVFDIEMTEALDIGAALNMNMAVAVPFFDEGSIPLGEVIESFGRFCDVAKPYGISIDLEPIPFWGLRDLPIAWEVVRAADRDNSGIVIDTWHIQKGSKDYERDIALLQAIPGKRLRHVQLADADLQSRADTLSGDVMFRKYPGEGELDITRMLSIIAGKGCLESVGPEIVNAEQAAMSNAGIGERSGLTTRDAVRRAYAALGRNAPPL